MDLVPEGRCEQVPLIMFNVSISIVGSDDARVRIPGYLEGVESMVLIDKV